MTDYQCPKGILYNKSNPINTEIILGYDKLRQIKVKFKK